MATNTQKKAQAHMAARDTRPAAHAKYVRISSRKVKIVIDLIRGKNVDDALAILQYTPKAAAPVVHKLLSSAIANAVNNNEMDRKALYVAEIYRRFRTRLSATAKCSPSPPGAACGKACSIEKLRPRRCITLRATPPRS